MRFVIIENKFIQAQRTCYGIFQIMCNDRKDLILLPVKFLKLFVSLFYFFFCFFRFVIFRTTSRYRGFLPSSTTEITAEYQCFSLLLTIV